MGDYLNFIKVWDGVNDPIMGGLMDSVKIGKSKSKFKPWMKIGMIGLVASGALVFLPIQSAPMALKITVCIITYLAWDVFYTLMNVPYGALNSAITPDPLERTQLSTWRSIGAGVGGIFCLALPLFIYDKEDNIMGGRLFWLALAMGALSFFAFYACLKMTKERVVTESAFSDKQKFNYLYTLKNFFKNRPLLAMCLASFAMIVFFMSNAQTTKWLFQVYFGSAGAALTIAGIVTYLPMLVFIPLTSIIVKKFGKKLAAGVPLVVSIVSAVILLCVPISRDVGGAVVYVIGLMFIQMGGGIFQLVCWAMITDCVDYQEIKSGRREEGSVYALYSLFRKIAQGVALSLPMMCMVWVGYNAAANPIGNQAAGVPEKMLSMAIGLMLIGAVIMLFALLVVYNLGQKEVSEQGVLLGRSAEDVDINDALINKNE